MDSATTQNNYEKSGQLSIHLPMTGLRTPYYITNKDDAPIKVFIADDWVKDLPVGEKREFKRPHPIMVWLHRKLTSL